jgi:hypothetical protein
MDVQLNFFITDKINQLGREMPVFFFFFGGTGV